MSHYEISYAKMDQAEADAKAISDCEDYSPRAMEIIEKEFFGLGQGKIGFALAKDYLHALSFVCMMTGIQGYPVRAIKRRFLAQFAKKGV